MCINLAFEQVLGMVEGLVISVLVVNCYKSVDVFAGLWEAEEVLINFPIPLLCRQASW